MIQPEAQPAPPDAGAPEAELTDEQKEAFKTYVDPVVGRLLVSTVDEKKTYLYPGHKLKSEHSEEAKQNAQNAQTPLPDLNDVRNSLKNELISKPKDLDYKPADEALFDKREGYWEQWENAQEQKIEGDSEEDKQKRFDRQNKAWNSEFWGWMEKGAREGENKDEFVDTLKSIGIDITKGETNADGLHQDIENFRAEYIKSKKEESTIKTFVEKMAETCTEEGRVDVDKLKNRLAILHDKGFMNAFGEIDEDVHTMVEKYVIARGLMDVMQQNKKAGDVIADEAVNSASNYVPKGSQERRVLEKLYATNKKLSGEPEEPPGPADEPSPSPEQQPTATASPPPAPIGESPSAPAEPPAPTETSQPAPIAKPAAETTNEGEFTNSSGDKFYASMDNGSVILRSKETPSVTMLSPDAFRQAQERGDWRRVQEKSAETPAATPAQGDQATDVAPERPESDAEGVKEGDKYLYGTISGKITEIRGRNLTDNPDQPQEATGGAGPTTDVGDNKTAQLGVGTPVSYLEIPGKVMNVFDDGTVLLEIGGEVYPKPIALTNPNLKW